MNIPRYIKPLSSLVGRVVNVNRFLASARERALAHRARQHKVEPLRKALIISIAYGPTSPVPSRSNSLATPTTLPSNPEGSPIARCAPSVEDDPCPAVGLPDGPPIPRSQGTILRRAHKDGNGIAELLKRKYNFQPQDIIRLADFGTHKQPTAANIRAAIRKLYKGARAGSNLFFAFIGHGGQKENLDGTEVDGQDELIITVDNKEILDDELYRLLVDRLPGGAKLTAVFDCCHSGTALDLSYSSEHPDQPVLPANRTVTVENIGQPEPPSYRKLIRSVSRCAGSRFLSSQYRPGADAAIGHVGRTVVSISACRDNQSAYEFINGYSLTDLIVRYIELYGHTSISSLMDRLRRKYVCIDGLIRGRGKFLDGWTGQEPQFSSNHSLDKAKDEPFIFMDPAPDPAPSVDSQPATEPVAQPLPVACQA